MASLSAADVKKLKVTELKDELTARGLDATGLKAALVERLIEAIESPSEVPNPEGGAVGSGDAAPAVKEAAAAEEGSADPAAEADAAATDAEGAKDAAEVVPGPYELELEKRKKRAERFGLPFEMTEDEKRKLRKERFGETVEDKTKMDLGTVDEEAKRKAREARFGSKATGTSTDEAAKLAARTARFGTDAGKEMGRKGLPVKAGGKRAGGFVLNPEDEAKKKARLERFAEKSA